MLIWKVSLNVASPPALSFVLVLTDSPRCLPPSSNLPSCKVNLMYGSCNPVSVSEDRHRDKHHKKCPHRFIHETSSLRSSGERQHCKEIKINSQLICRVSNLGSNQPSMDSFPAMGIAMIFLKKFLSHLN